MSGSHSFEMKTHTTFKNADSQGNIWPSGSSVSASADSRNHGLEILEKSYTVAGVYCVVRPAMVASVLNMDRLFSLKKPLFPKQYSVTTTYIAFT